MLSTINIHHKMRSLRSLVFLFILVALTIECSCASPKYHRYSKSSEGEVEIGIASWYGSDFHGRPTSSGEIYNMYDLTAAHKTLPLGTYVMVTNTENKKSVEVKINDRGPFVKGRIIDLSYAGAKALEMVDSGTAMVKVAVTRRVKHHTLPYTLQVSSFKEKANALSLKRKLDKRYRDVHIVVTRTAGTKYYRVRMGYFSSRESAQETAQRLLREGYAVFMTMRD